MTKDEQIQDLKNQLKTLDNITDPMSYGLQERGPFFIAAIQGNRATLQSDDFTYDINVSFNGDLLPPQARAYAHWLCTVLNAACGHPPCPRTKSGAHGTQEDV